MSDGSAVPATREVPGSDAPSNRGRWGPDDELGCLSHLDAGEVLRGVRHLRSGEVFTLQIPMGRTESPGDPLWPGREGIKRQNVMDEGTWDAEGAPQFPGGLHHADADNRWSFLYAAAPLKVVNGTGAPVDPIAIR